MAQTFVDYTQGQNVAYRASVADGDEVVVLLSATNCPKTIKVFPSSTATISTTASEESVIRAGNENRSVAASASSSDFADILYEAATAVIVSASGGAAAVEIVI